VDTSASRRFRQKPVVQDYHPVHHLNVVSTPVKPWWWWKEAEGVNERTSLPFSPGRVRSHNEIEPRPDRRDLGSGEAKPDGDRITNHQLPRFELLLLN
jgi:hypothetical protein